MAPSGAGRTLLLLLPSIFGSCIFLAVPARAAFLVHQKRPSPLSTATNKGSVGAYSRLLPSATGAGIGSGRIGIRHVAAGSATTSTRRSLASEYRETPPPPEGGESDSGGGGALPFFLDPGTRGGVAFLSLAAFVLPLAGYNVAVSGYFQMDPVDAGRWFGAGFAAVALMAWVGTVIYRVSTKNMTYVSAAYRIGGELSRRLRSALSPRLRPFAFR